MTENKCSCGTEMVECVAINGQRMFRCPRCPGIEIAGRKFNAQHKTVIDLSWPRPMCGCTVCTEARVSENAQHLKKDDKEPKVNSPKKDK